MAGSDVVGRLLSDLFRERVLKANEVRRFADSLVESDKRGIRHLRHYLTPVFDQGRYAPDCRAWPISYRPKAHFVHAFGRTPGGVLQLQTHVNPREGFRSEAALCHAHPSVKTAFQCLESLVGGLFNELAQKKLIAIGTEVTGDTARIPEQWWESETTWVDFSSGELGEGMLPDATVPTSILGNALGAQFDIFSNVVICGSDSAPDVPVSSLRPRTNAFAASKSTIDSGEHVGDDEDAAAHVTASEARVRNTKTMVWEHVVELAGAGTDLRRITRSSYPQMFRERFPNVGTRVSDGTLGDYFKKSRQDFERDAIREKSR